MPLGKLRYIRPECHFLIMVNKFLIVILILSSVLIIFEAGAYFTLSTTKDDRLNGTLSDYACPTEPTDQSNSFRDVTGKEVTGTSAVNKSFVSEYISTLYHINNGLLAQSKLDNIFRGVIFDIRLDASFPLNGKSYNHYFLLGLRDPKTNIIAYVERVPNRDLGMFTFYSKERSSDQPTLITASDLKIGDYVEVAEGVDFVKNTSKIAVTLIKNP